MLIRLGPKGSPVPLEEPCERRLVDRDLPDQIGMLNREPQADAPSGGIADEVGGASPRFLIRQARSAMSSFMVPWLGSGMLCPWPRPS